MENATKALIMAASVLIALVIISAILLVFNNLNDYQKVSQQVKEDAKIIEFNNKFETYNRTDVRGSDMFSLINKVIDYNERQSYMGEEGSDLGYKPIKLTINLKPNGNTSYIKNIEVPNADSNNRKLINADSYVIYTNTGKFYTTGFGKITKDISDIENNNSANLNQTELTELTVAITSIFLPDNSNEREKANAMKKFNDITGSNIKLWNSSTIGEGSQIRTDIYKYYEYIQFKRCYFDCVSEDGKEPGVKYDDNGRIIEMYYVLNGKVE